LYVGIYTIILIESIVKLHQFEKFIFRAIVLEKMTVVIEVKKLEPKVPGIHQHILVLESQVWDFQYSIILNPEKLLL